MLATLFYSFALRRWVGGAWSECSRRMAPILAVFAGVVLLIVLGYEFVLFNPDPVP